MQYAAFQTPPFDGLHLGVHIVDRVLNDNGEDKGGYSLHCQLETLEISSIIANGKVEIPSHQLLARTKCPYYGSHAVTMAQEMLQGIPVESGGWMYEFHPKNETVMITKDRVVIDSKHLNEFRQKMAASQAKSVAPEIEEYGATEQAYASAAYDETELNGASINWRYWVHQMPMLTAAQAARLMSGLEPDLFDDLNNRPGTDDPKQETQKARKIQRLAEAQGRLTESPAFLFISSRRLCYQREHRYGSRSGAWQLHGFAVGA